MNSPRQSLILTIISLVIAIFSAPQSQGYSSTPPPATTGAPGHQSCASCHTSVGSGSVSLSFSGNNEYQAGQPYSLNVTIVDTKIRFGFSMVSRETDENTVSTGTWSAGGSDTKTYGNSETHVGHKNAPNSATSPYTYTVNWTAPAAGTGDVTFYVASVAANGFGNSGPGDNVYLTNLTISEMGDPEPPTLTDPKILPNGSMQFLLTGIQATNYKVEFMDATLAWQLLENITLSTTTQLVSDPGAPTSQSRIYRALEIIP